MDPKNGTKSVTLPIFLFSLTESLIDKLSIKSVLSRNAVFKIRTNEWRGAKHKIAIVRYDKQKNIPLGSFSSLNEPTSAPVLVQKILFRHYTFKKIFNWHFHSSGLVV